MRFLELKIPPPVVGLIVAAGMWAVAHLLPILQLPKLVRLLVAAVLGAIGVAVAIGGVLSFRRAKTTVNPLKPETSAALVSTACTHYEQSMYLAWWCFCSRGPCTCLRLGP